MKMFYVTLTTALFALISTAHASDNSEHDFVKKSSNGYCHYKTSAFFDRTRRFTRFETLSECLDHGGQMPPTNQNLRSENLVKFSRSRICHAPDSPHYEQTRHFVAFKTIDDCVKHGGQQ